jgi:ABC-type nitrate/sulfonate/bicarbonate transport system substrate-binding protein
MEFTPAPIVRLAEHRGSFATNDLTVERIVTRSSSEQRDAIAGGDVDVGLTAMDNALPWNASGGDFRIVGQIDRTMMQDLMASSDVNAATDLVGKVLAVDAPDTGFAIALRYLLAHLGVPDGACRLLAVGGVTERCEALCAGEASAALLSPPQTQAAERRGIHRLTTVQEHFPAFPGLVVVADAKRAAVMRPELEAYLAALEETARWAAAAEHSVLAQALVDAGMPVSDAAAAIDVLPTTVAPSRAGLELVMQMRDALGLLDPKAGTPDHVLDESYLRGAAPKEKLN